MSPTGREDGWVEEVSCKQQMTGPDRALTSAHHVAEAAEADDADLQARLVQVVVLERRVDGDAGAQQRRRAVQRQVARDVQHEAARTPSQTGDQHAELEVDDMAPNSACVMKLVAAATNPKQTQRKATREGRGTPPIAARDEGVDDRNRAVSTNIVQPLMP